MSMSLSSLRYALATAELGSFSKAARACQVSQPTVSNAVAQLEEQLGAQLFSRSTRGPVLTEFGKHVLPRIRAVVDAQAELIRESTAFQDPPLKLVRVGFSPLFGGQLVVRWLEPFAKRYSDVEVVYKECSVNDMEERLSTHRIDVIFTPRPANRTGQRSTVFHREELRFLRQGGMSAQAKLRWQTGVSLEDIAQELLVFTQGDCGLAPTTRELFRRRGLEPREYRGEALSYSVLEEWADLGIGGAILPPSRISADPSRFPIIVDDGSPANIEYRAVWNHDTLRPRHLSAFIEYIKTTLPKLLGGDSLTVAG